MEKKLVIPGELVSEERKRLGGHVFIENGKIYSDTLGIVADEPQAISVIPLQGKYMPCRGDVVVGIVAQEKFAGFIIDINSFYFSFVSKKEIRESLKVGSIVSAKIFEVNEINEAELGDIRLFIGGEIVSVSAVKVPRVIGKNGSMLDVLKNGTNCNIVVGRNGRIWIKGGNIELFLKAIKKIEDEAHLSNLTNKMTAFMEENKTAAV